MTGADDWFVDTNVLVYASQTQSPWHAQAEVALRAGEAAGTAFWISGQIVREYLAVVTRPQKEQEAVPMAQAIDRVRFFAQCFEMAEDGPAVREQLLTLPRMGTIAGRQVHDANIAATMLANGITRILTFNATDFQRFRGMITIETP